MLKKIMCFIILLSFFGPAYASTARGKVSKVFVRDSDGLVYVVIEGTRTEKPACATGSYLMIKNEKSLVGKQQLTLLLMAQATNKVVSIVGYDTCSRWGNGEDINYITIEK